MIAREKISTKTIGKQIYKNWILSYQSAEKGDMMVFFELRCANWIPFSSGHEIIKSKTSTIYKGRVDRFQNQPR